LRRLGSEHGAAIHVIYGVAAESIIVMMAGNMQQVLPVHGWYVVVVGVQAPGEL
jgi:hypothetical protein